MVTDVFVGRRAELEELRSAADTATKGRGSLSLLLGEPGIGKTRLADAVADYGATIGMTVHRAACWDGPTAPFWPWTQLLRSHLSVNGGDDVPDHVRALAGHVDGVAADTSEAESARFALFDAITTFFRSASADRPLLLVIDDLHWADLGSLRLLELFTRDLRDANILVVGTYRDVEVDPKTDAGEALDKLTDVGSVVRLEGLRATEVAELLQASTGHLAATELARAVHDRTAGNPLFVRELGRLLAAQGKIDVPVSSLPVPEGVRGVIRRRLARLSQGTNELLGVASVLGAEFRPDVVAVVAGKSLEITQSLLDDARDARLVLDIEGAVGRSMFSHALVYEVVYDAMAATQRAKLHRRAAEALEATDASDRLLAELAHHYALAGVAEKAVDYSERAGRRALEQLAYEDATVHFHQAIDALELAPDDDRRSELLLALGDAQLRCGDMPGARETFEEAANAARRRSRPDELARAALGFGAGLEGFEIRMIDYDQIRLLEEALAALGPEDSSLRAWVLARLSVALSYQESTERRLVVAEEAVAMARRIGDERALTYALASHCDAIAGPADSERRVEEASEIVAIALQRGDRPIELLGRRLLVKAHLERGDLSAATEQMDAFERTAEVIKQPLYSWFVPLWKGFRRLLRGELDVALAYAAEAEQIGTRAHSVNGPMLATVMRLVTEYYAERGDRMLAEAKLTHSITEYFAEGYADYYLGTVHALSGDISTAAPLVRRFASTTFKQLPMDAEFLAFAAMFSEAVWLVRDEAAAADLYPVALPFRHRYAVEGIGAGSYGSMEHYLGLAARTLGRDDDAEAHFHAALEANARLHAPLMMARTQRELARLYEARGETERAFALMEEVNAVHRALGIGDDTPAATSTAAFRREGEFWTLAYEGSTVRVKDVKGLHDIAKLLARPGREIAALDLATEVGTPKRAAAEDALDAPGHAGELLDDEARAQYKERLAELEDDIADADALGDAVRAERARAERDAIAHELSAAYGLGGRARKAGDPAERARTTVTRRIREAIGRVEELHPALGRHLRSAIKTGMFCSYEPERPVDWEL